MKQSSFCLYFPNESCSCAIAIAVANFAIEETNRSKEKENARTTHFLFTFQIKDFDDMEWNGT